MSDLAVKASEKVKKSLGEQINSKMLQYMSSVDLHFEDYFGSLAGKQRDIIKRKVLFLIAYQFTQNISIACNVAGISRRTYYNYKSEDPKFKQAFEDASEIKVDLAEQKGVEGLLEGDPKMVRYFLSTLGKDRGYTQEKLHTHKQEIKIESKNILPPIEEARQEIRNNPELENLTEEQENEILKQRGYSSQRIESIEADYEEITEEE